MVALAPPPSTDRTITVGLRGLAGVGKTTLASLLVKHWREQCYGLDFEIRSMAGPMKEGLAHMGITKKKEPDLYRRFAQDIGAACRAKDQDFWVKQLCTSPLHNTVIDDVRYPNEAGVCDLLFYIEPVGFPPIDLKERGTHESELWNLLREGRIDAVIKNPKDNPDTAVREMVVYITARLAALVGSPA